MIKNDYLLSIILLSSLATTALAETNNNERYQQIIQNFSAQDQSFNNTFIATNEDIAIITQHKENAEKELTGYQKSWVPTFLKIVGGAFGLDAALSSITIMFMAAHAPREWHDVRQTISNYIGYPIKPIRYTIYTLAKPIAQPMSKKLFDMYIKEKSIGARTYDLGMTSITTGLYVVPSTVIAAYLFKKANSYQSEIERLEKEIELDDMMIKKLNDLH